MLNKLNVAFLGGRGFNSFYGGVEHATREVVSKLVNLNEYNLLVYGVNSEEKKQRIFTDNLHVINAPSKIYSNFGQYGMILWCVLHIIFIARPNVVVVFASGPCIFIPLLRLFKIKVISSLRAIDSKRDKWGVVNKKILEMGEYFSWYFSNEFTVNSLAMQKYYLDKRKAHFIPNGCEKVDSSNKVLPLENRLLNEKQYLFFAGRFDPVKRLHILLEAHAELDKDKVLPLVIAGGNSKDKKYEEYLHSFASKHVIFLGHVTSDVVDSYMFNCKAFILPSVLEGMSNSLLSAMINAKPVLAADVEENFDVLKLTDAVFKADDKNDLKIKINKLIANEEFCLVLGKELQKIAEVNYSWDNTALKFHILIKNICEG